MCGHEPKETEMKKVTLLLSALLLSSSCFTVLQAQEKLPWNLNIYYNVTYTKILNKVKDIPALNFSGDIAVTKYWKLGMTSGYDFTNRNLSYTSINIYRDLRCWEARIDWVPFGFRKSYSLTINLKTSMLSDVKIPRQRQWYDNF